MGGAHDAATGERDPARHGQGSRPHAPLTIAAPACAGRGLDDSLVGRVRRASCTLVASFDDVQSTSSEGTCVSRCTPGVGAADCNTVNFMLGSRCELLRCDRCLPDDCVLTSTSFLGSTTKVLTALPQSRGELPPTESVLHLDASKATGCAAVDSASGLRFSAWAADSTGGTMGGEVQRGRFYGTSALDLESSRLASSALLQLGDAFTLAFWVAFAPDAGDVDADAGAARVPPSRAPARITSPSTRIRRRPPPRRAQGRRSTPARSAPSRQWVLVVAGTCEGTTNDPKGVLRFSSARTRGARAE